MNPFASREWENESTECLKDFIPYDIRINCCGNLRMAKMRQVNLERKREFG